jgi:hypothetical protein
MAAGAGGGGLLGDAGKAGGAAGLASKIPGGAILPALLAIGGAGQIISGKAADHNPNRGDIGHTSQWTVDAGHFIASGFVNVLQSSGLFHRPDNKGPVDPPSMVKLAGEVAKDKTIEGKFATLNSYQAKWGAQQTKDSSLLAAISGGGSLFLTSQHLQAMRKELASEKSLGLSKAVQEKTQAEITKTTSHLDTIKGLMGNVATDKHNVEGAATLAGHLRDVVKATGATDTKIGAGIEVKKIPAPPKQTVSGQLKLIFH